MGLEAQTTKTRKNATNNTASKRSKRTQISQKKSPKSQIATSLSIPIPNKSPKRRLDGGSEKTTLKPSNNIRNCFHNYIKIWQTIRRRVTVLLDKDSMGVSDFRSVGVG